MSKESEKKRLLILGSGFSKAVSDKMPVVRELAQALKEHIEKNQDRDRDLQALKESQYQHLLSDPEMLLTYLAQDQPWKEPWEAPKEWALFLKISEWLAKYIAGCEKQAFENEIPEWAKRLAKWLHETRTPVITFNYDTILERICFHHVNYVGPTTREVDAATGAIVQAGQPLYASNLYRIPLALIPQRVAATSLPPPQSTFHLVKLHGSINWFYSGGEQFPGEQIYMRLVDSRSPFRDMVEVPPGAPPPPTNLEDEIKKLLSDKAYLIIPPVAEKSRFYANRTIRSLWGKAREYLNQAEEIYCVGYSLPDTDLTTKLLLQTACAGKIKTVYIVNNDVKGKEDLVRRYKDAFPKETSIKDDYIQDHDDRDKAVKAMTEYLCKEG